MVNPAQPEVHESTLDQPAHTDSSHSSYRKLRDLHGRVSTGLNGLMDEPPVLGGSPDPITHHDSNRPHLPLHTPLYLCPEHPVNERDSKDERIISRITAVFSWIRSKILASVTKVRVDFSSTEQELKIFSVKDKFLLFLPRPGKALQLKLKKSKLCYRFHFPEAEEILWLEFSRPDEEFWLTCPQSKKKFSWCCSDTDEARLFFDGSVKSLGIGIYHQGLISRVVAALLRIRQGIQVFISAVCEAFTSDFSRI